MVHIRVRHARTFDNGKIGVLKTFWEMKSNIVMKRQAKIRFSSRIEGGRNDPPLSGYHPQLRFDDEQTTCTITPIDETIEIMDFDVQYLVNIELMFETMYTKKISKNM
jgi:hypothetical protein